MNKELEVFISSCLKEYEYQSLGDNKNGNKQGINITSICIQLKKENRLHELLNLLEHEHPQVRFRAAEKTLIAFPQKAEKVLIELSTLRGLQF